MTKPPKTIEISPEELEKLTLHVRAGAAAIANIWDVLDEIGARLNIDWEPKGTSVTDILASFASMLDEPANPLTIDSGSILESFNEGKNWGEKSPTG